MKLRKITIKTYLKFLILAVAASLGHAAISANISDAFIAVESGQIEEVKKFFEKNPNFNINEKNPNERGETILIRAAYREYYDIIVYLMEQGADPNVQDNNGHSPLKWLVIYENFNGIRYLVNHGANLNIEYIWGAATPLMKATIEGSFDIVKYLVDHGARLNTTNEFGQTPLMLANYRKDHFNIWNTIALYLTNVENYLEESTIVTSNSSDQNQQIAPNTIPNFLSLAIRINNPYHIAYFAQIPQFENHQYLPNIRHFAKFMQLPNDKNDGIVTALWFYNQLNRNAKVIKTPAGFKFETQKNLYKNERIQKLHDTQFIYQLCDESSTGTKRKDRDETFVSCKKLKE